MSTATGVPPDLHAVVEYAREGPPLDVTANLSVAVDGVDLAVSSVDDRLRVQVPSLAAGVSVLRAIPDGGSRLPEALAAAGLTAEVRIGSAVVAVLGADAAADRLARRLGLASVELRTRGLVAAALRLR